MQFPLKKIEVKESRNINAKVVQRSVLLFQPSIQDQTLTHALHWTTPYTKSPLTKGHVPTPPIAHQLWTGGLGVYRNVQMLPACRRGAGGFLLLHLCSEQSWVLRPSKTHSDPIRFTNRAVAPPRNPESSISEAHMQDEHDKLLFIGQNQTQFCLNAGQNVLTVDFVLF